MLPEIPDLRQSLADLARQIPCGTVTTFGDLAKGLGDVAAARWVATVLAESPADLPWQRVILRTNCWPGRDSARQKLQRKLLAAEGVAGDAAGVARDVPRFTEFSGPRPLALLSDWQRESAQHVERSPLRQRPATLAGLDISYATPDLAVAAWVQSPRNAPRQQVELTISSLVTFPYITGYLTFRELPVLLELVRAAEREGLAADVLLVDGSGVLHPRRAGIATALGALTGLPTIGVTKHHLYGKAEAARDEIVTWLQQDGERLGARLQPPGRKTPLYVSVGHGLSLEQAVELVEESLDDSGQPGLIRAADGISRATARILSRQAGGYAGGASTTTSAD
ncbi:endonuclease V [Planctellipticum variicoloris]|uniref:endonuclease V n=1 Tax=Planctellipticum variicoloris TaxID=3064265 RepID=UPI002C6F5BF0|nr:endonuclease V [Planctomycetaceae bacterium SH412]HTN02400.1 endonuclease V [Planctomycetaceae bacterium]